jgi:hypothetical protein
MSLFSKCLPVLPDETLFDLENRLLEPHFMGVSIGLTLTTCLNTHLPVNPLSAILSAAHWVKFCWFGHRGSKPLPQLPTGRVLITWLSDTQRFNDLVLPVAKELSPDQYNVIAAEPDVLKLIPDGVGYCTRYQVCGVDLAVWRREYRRCRGLWHRQLWCWLHVHQLSGWLFPYIAYALAVRSLYVYGFLCFLDRVRPTLVLADSEHNHPWACLVLAARRRKIPTLQMMHCAIYTSYIFCPLLSDAALCWGAQQREQMSSFGVEPERLLVVGCQRLTRKVSVERGWVRAKLDLPLDAPVVMLATNRIAREKWQKQVFAFGDALSACPRWTGVVRLHPSETRALYADEMAKYPRIRFFESGEWTVEESMAACDVVVSHNSGLGNDALVMGRPVVILDVLGEPMSNGQVLADKAGCPVAKTADQLRQTVFRILDDEKYRKTIRDRAEEYVMWFCSAYGQQAARNVADVVRKRIGVAS